MKIKRLAASISACFDDLITKVENHEAVAQVAISDVRKAAAKIRAEKIKVEQSETRLNVRLNEQQQAKKLWHQRARACVSSDEQKAMQCLQQAKKIESQIGHTQEQLASMNTLSENLSDSLQAVESKLAELNSKRAMLVSRQTRAEVHAKTQKAVGEINVNDIFDRWELNILQAEYEDESIAFTDSESQIQFNSLAREFSQQEEQEALSLALAELKSSVMNDEKTESSSGQSHRHLEG